MRHSLLTSLLTALLALAGTSAISQESPDDLPRFRYHFEIDPPVVADGGTLTGAPGETVRVTIYAVLETLENPTETGVTGWSLSIHGEGLSFDPATVETKDTVGIPLFFYSPSVVNPDQAGHPESVFAGGPQGEGVIDGVALSLTRELAPEGSQRLLRVEAEVVIPGAGEAPRPVRLAFIDGKAGIGQPIDNEVTFEGLSVEPHERVEFTFEASSAVFRRGDADASGAVELTDVIFTLGHLFLGQPPPPCPDAADVDDNGVVELTDTIYSLGYQFLGQAPPPAPGPFTCGADSTPADPPLATCDYAPAACADDA